MPLKSLSPISKLQRHFRPIFGLTLIGLMWLIAALMLFAPPNDVQADENTPPIPGDTVSGEFAAGELAMSDSPAPNAPHDPALDAAFTQAAAAYSARPGVNFYFEELGRNTDPNAAVIYATTRDKTTNSLMPGRTLIILAIKDNNTWLIVFPGDPNYTTTMERFPPSLVARIDPTPYDMASAGSADPLVPQALDDFRLPWAHGQWATISRSFNVHGAGQIDAVLDGSQIVAAKSGTIIYVNDTNTINAYASGAWWYWNTVVIYHGPNDYTTYGHFLPNSVPAWIKAGCTTNYASQNCAVAVQAGQVIGLQGNTGYSSGPHLHIQFGTTFVMDTRFSVPTGYGWGLHNVSFYGYTESQGYTWPYGRRLQAQHVAPPRIPAYQNVVDNGAFGAVFNNWQTWGDLVYGIADGALSFRRLPTDPNGYVSIFQDLSYSAGNNTPFELALQMGNAGSDPKEISIALTNGVDNQGIVTCSFTMPPNLPLSTYTLRGRNSATWGSIRMRVRLMTASTSILMDNVSVKYRPDINPSGTECVQPIYAPTLTTPTGTITTVMGNPRYIWGHLPNTISYEIAIFRSDNLAAPVYYGTNLLVTTYCSNGTCSIDPTTQPTANEAARLSNGQHEVYVRATDGTWSRPYYFTLNAPPPTPPTLAAPTGTNTLRPLFTWTVGNDGVNSTQFRVFIIPKAAYDAANYTGLLDQWYSRTSRCGTLTGMTCSFQVPFDLAEDTDYYLFLQSYGLGGFSAGGSNNNGWTGVTFRINSLTDAAVPSNVAVTGNQGHPTITWADEANSSSYYVYIRNQATMATVHLAWVQKAGTALCNSGICSLTPTPELSLANGTYEVYIYACGSGGCSTGGPWNNGWGGTAPNNTFTLNLAPPLLASNLIASANGGTINASWTAPAGTSWFYVWAGTAGGAQTYYWQWHSAPSLGCAAPGQTCTISLPLNLGAGTVYVAVQSAGPGGWQTTGGQVNNGYQVSGEIIIP